MSLSFRISTESSQVKHIYRKNSFHCRPGEVTPGVESPDIRLVGAGNSPLKLETYKRLLRVLLSD